jgi:hypothetical protein
MYLYMTHHNYRKESLSQVRSALTADISTLTAPYQIGGSVKNESSNTVQASEYRNTMDIRFNRNGGILSTAPSFEEVLSNYGPWVASLKDNPGVISDIAKVTVVYTWDIAAAVGKPELARAMKQEFFRQAMARIDELENSFPGQFFTSMEKTYGPGSAVYNHPAQYITDDEGTKNSILVRYVIYIAGASAGGNPYSSWGVNGNLQGGSGAGGSLIKLTIYSYEGLKAVISPGHAGHGGVENRGHARPAESPGPGGNSSVVINGHTFTAGGGQPSVYSDYRYYPAPGGIGTPLIPPDFVTEYVIANGQSTNGIWNQPGAGGKIDKVQAGTGGIGGTGSNGGYGRMGEDGFVKVTCYYYDGQ